MSKIYPNLEDFTVVDTQQHRSSTNSDTNCGQIFSKTRNIIEKFEETELGPKTTHICGRTFKTRQLWVLVGLLLLFASSFMGLVLMYCTSMFDSFVQSSIIINNQSSIYDIWRDPEVTMTIKVYIFNYTNVDEYKQEEAEKLIVKEVGPFVYEETTEKVDIKFNPNGTVSYRLKHTHKYRPDLSKGRRQSDQLIVPNMPLFGAAAVSKHSYYFTRLTMSTVLQSLNSEPFLKLPAHRFIWGYDDTFYELAKGVLSFQKELPFEKFGILAARNGTSSDVITVNTGIKDANTMNQIDNFNGETSIHHWSTDECNKIRGSDGTSFPINEIRHKRPVAIYTKEFCRTLPFIYQKETRILNGKVPAYRYVLPDFAFDTPDTNPENQCYCDLDSGNCSPRGVFNTTPCSFGAPAFISFPHFYNADPTVRDAISGLNPNPSEHESYIDVHPYLGFSMGGKNRLQMNVQVKKSFGMSQLDMFEDDMILPIAWIDISVDDSNLSNKAKEQIYLTTFTIPAVEMSLKYGSLLTVIVTSISLTIVLVAMRKEQAQRHRTNTN